MTIADGFKKINFERYRNIFLFASLPIIIITIVFGFVGFHFNISTLVRAFEFLFQVTLSFLSLSIACHSIVLSRKASKIATSSDNKMKSIANVQFLQVVNMLEDARIEFIKTLRGKTGYKPELFTWKTRSTVEMAVELLKIDETKKYIDPRYEKKLLQYFKLSFDHFVICENWQTEIKSHKHLIESYAMLDEYYGDILKQEFKNSITDQVNKVFKDFYGRVEEKKKKLIEDRENPVKLV